MFSEIELFGYKLIYGLLQIINKYKLSNTGARCAPLTRQIGARAERVEKLELEFVHDGDTVHLEVLLISTQSDLVSSLK